VKLDAAGLPSFEVGGRFVGGADAFRRQRTV
jgi:hypothetical protein